MWLHVAKSVDEKPGPATKFLFLGALIDGTPSRPDTVLTCRLPRNGLKVSVGHACDMKKLYASLLVISPPKRDIHLQDLFRCEVAPVPSLLFNEYGNMRKGTKSTLISKLAVNAAALLDPVDLEVVDVKEALCHIRAL